MSLPLFNKEALAAPERDPKKSILRENWDLYMPEAQGRFVSLFKTFGPRALARNPGSRADPCASQQLFIIRIYYYYYQQQQQQRTRRDFSPIHYYY